jgi:hyperosmotically inducible periplasmic protein
MMNSNSTPKIVVGIGLAAVFGVGVSMFAVRAKQESEIARTAPPAAVAAAPSDQNAADATAPAAAAAAQTPVDQAATAPSAPATAPVAAVPAPSTPSAAVAASDQSDSDKSKGHSDRHVARTRDSANTRVASAAGSNTRSADMTVTSAQQAAVVAPSGDTTLSDTTSSAPAGASADTQPAPAQTAQQAPAASDSQITADVKTEIATAAPDSNVIVTTTNGVVALAGSAPSQNAAEQAKQAAQRVAGAGHVDASGLTVMNP